MRALLPVSSVSIQVSASSHLILGAPSIGLAYFLGPPLAGRKHYPPLGLSRLTGIFFLITRRYRSGRARSNKRPPDTLRARRRYLFPSLFARPGSLSRVLPATGPRLILLHSSRALSASRRYVGRGGGRRGPPKITLRAAEPSVGGLYLTLLRWRDRRGVVCARFAQSINQ